MFLTGTAAQMLMWILKGRRGRYGGGGNRRGEHHHPAPVSPETTGTEASPETTQSLWRYFNSRVAATPWHLVQGVQVGTPVASLLLCHSQKAPGTSEEQVQGLPRQNGWSSPLPTGLLLTSGQHPQVARVKYQEVRMQNESVS